MGGRGNFWIHWHLVVKLLELIKFPRNGMWRERGAENGTWAMTKMKRVERGRSSMAKQEDARRVFRVPGLDVSLTLFSRPEKSDMHVLLSLTAASEEF